MSDKRIIFYIIDEDENSSDTLQKLISKLFPNMYVKKFSDGFNAWKSLEKETLEVVLLCEYNLSSINGLQLLKKVKSDERFKDYNYIMMSSSNDRELLIKAVQAGVDNFINKPLSIDVILLTLKNTSKILSMQDKVARLEEELSCLKNDIEPQREKLRNLLKFIQFERIPDKKEAIGRIVAASKFIAGS
jgi:two-component system chemotaxis response regulator CheY